MPPRLNRLLVYRRRASTRAQGLVEFALVLPVLLLLVFGIIGGALLPQVAARIADAAGALQPAFVVPMLGYVAAGIPIEAVTTAETIAVPEDLAGRRDAYVLRVKGDSMIDEQIRDGDFVIVEDRKTAENGEMVIALLGGHEVTLKKFYREHGRIRLQPANPAMQPIFADPATVQLQGVVVGVMRKY